MKYDEKNKGQKAKITAEEIIKTFNSLSKEEQDKILKKCGLERRR